MFCVQLRLCRLLSRLYIKGPVIFYYFPGCFLEHVGNMKPIILKILIYTYKLILINYNNDNYSYYDVYLYSSYQNQQRKIKSNSKYKGQKPYLYLNACTLCGVMKEYNSVQWIIHLSFLVKIRKLHRRCMVV